MERVATNSDGRISRRCREMRKVIAMEDGAFDGG